MNATSSFSVTAAAGSSAAAPTTIAPAPPNSLAPALRGLAIGLALFLLTALAGLLFTAAVFDYSVGALV